MPFTLHRKVRVRPPPTRRCPDTPQSKSSPPRHQVVAATRCPNKILRELVEPTQGSKGSSGTISPLVRGDPSVDPGPLDSTQSDAARLARPTSTSARDRDVHTRASPAIDIADSTLAPTSAGRSAGQYGMAARADHSAGRQTAFTALLCDV